MVPQFLSCDETFGSSALFPLTALVKNTGTLNRPTFSRETPRITRYLEYHNGTQNDFPTPHSATSPQASRVTTDSRLRAARRHDTIGLSRRCQRRCRSHALRSPRRRPYTLGERPGRRGQVSLLIVIGSLACNGNGMRNKTTGGPRRAGGDSVPDASGGREGSGEDAWRVRG